MWVEGGSSNVSFDSCIISDVGAGGLRVGRGKPLSDEPVDHRTERVSVNNSIITDGSHVSLQPRIT